MQWDAERGCREHLDIRWGGDGQLNWLLSQSFKCGRVQQGGGSWHLGEAKTAWGQWAEVEERPGSEEH